MAHSRLYRSGVLEQENFPVEDCSDHLKDTDAVVWLDYCAPSADELARLGSELNLHTLAMEDALDRHERPKLDRYDDHLFIGAYAVKLDSETGALTTTEIAAFVTRQALVTVRKDEGFDMKSVTRRWDESPDLAKSGVAFLLWGLLDTVVDGHFDAVQQLDSEIEDLEDLLFDDRPRDVEVQRRSFELRKSLVRLRRVVLPVREVINSLIRRDLHVVDATMGPYYQDVYDHVLRVTEWTESLRDLVTTILESNLTIQGNRLNGIMKKVTSWAAIIAVPTAVTGFYGQNVPYPGFASHLGFWESTSLIVLLSVVLYALFRRRDWI